MTERVYTGKRVTYGENPGVFVEVTQDDERRPLSPRLELKEHSTTLEWGYGTGGPAQLALAILADVTGSDAYAERHYHWFKLDVVSRFAWDEWGLRESQIWDWINEHHPLTTS